MFKAFELMIELCPLNTITFNARKALKSLKPKDFRASGE
jgi:hypothetical protein